SPVQRKQGGGGMGWVLGLIVFALIAGGIGLAGSSGMFSGGAVAATTGDGGAADAATEPDAGTADLPPSRVDAVPSRRGDAGTDAGSAADAGPREDTGVR